MADARKARLSVAKLTERFEEALRRSPVVDRVKDWVERNLGFGGNIRIVGELGAFAPNSAGTYRARADLTVLSVNQTFPLLAVMLEKAGQPPLVATDIAEFCSSPGDAIHAAALKPLFDRYGSDKGSGHDYHLLYGHILGDGAAVRSLVEIGLGTNNPEVVSTMGSAGHPGASLRAFRDYLTGARIYGADVDKRILFSEDRISTCYVDQTDPASFAELESLVGPAIDVVIDDGLHAPNANLSVLNFALERLSVGGWVIIEDIVVTAEPIWAVIGALMPDSYEPVLLRAEGGVIFAARRKS